MLRQLAILILVILASTAALPAMTYFQVDYCNDVIPGLQFGNLQCYTQFWVLPDPKVFIVAVVLHTTAGTQVRSSVVSGGLAIVTFPVDWHTITSAPIITQQSGAMFAVRERQDR